MLRRRAALALRAARSAAPAEAHVLQSPGAPRRLLLSLLAQAGCLLAVRMVAPARAAAVEAALAAQLAALSAARNLQLWGVLSALASACCAAQLALSALSLGCSGLNARLGPLRPHALAFAAILQAAQWWAATRSAATAWQIPALATTTCAVACMSLLPEAIHTAGEYRRLARVAAAGGGHGNVELLELPTGKVGCSVCANAAEAACRGVKGVVNAEVSVASGVVTVAVHAGDKNSAARLEALRADICAALAKAGYAPDGGSDGEQEQRGDGEAKQASQHSVRDSMAALVGGLLGSSCCAVQLAANWLASLGVVTGGCTGLNKSLGPLRPQLRALTAAYFVAGWVAALWQGKMGNRRTLLRLATASVTAGVLTFLPELLLAFGSTAIAPPVDESLVTLSFAVEGMGCEACAAYVRGALARASGVVDAAADHERGTATLLVHPEWGFGDAAMAQVADGLAEAGYAMASRSSDGSVTLDFGDGLAAMLAPEPS